MPLAPEPSNGPFWAFLGVLATGLFGLAGKAWVDKRRPQAQGPHKPSIHEELASVIQTLNELKSGQTERAKDLRRIEDKIDRHIEFHLEHPSS